MYLTLSWEAVEMPPLPSAHEASGEKVEGAAVKRQPEDRGVEDIEGLAWDAGHSMADERHAYDAYGVVDRDTNWGRKVEDGTGAPSAPFAGRRAESPGEASSEEGWQCKSHHVALKQAAWA